METAGASRGADGRTLMCKAPRRMFLCSGVESFKTAVPNCSAWGYYIAFRPRGQSAKFYAEAEGLGVEIRFAEALTAEERETLFFWGENIFGVEDAQYR